MKTPIGGAVASTLGRHEFHFLLRTRLVLGACTAFLPNFILLCRQRADQAQCRLVVAGEDADELSEFCKNPNDCLN